MVQQNKGDHRWFASTAEECDQGIWSESAGHSKCFWFLKGIMMASRLTWVRWINTVVCGHILRKIFTVAMGC